MLWVILVLISAFLYSLVNILDKIAISREFRDPVFATFLYGLISFLAFGSIGFFIDVGAQGWIIFVSIILGIVAVASVYAYYDVLRRAEVSSFTPLLSVYPFFVVILAYLFLGELLTFVNYLGIALLVFGAVMISRNDKKFKIGFNRNFLTTMAIVLLIAIGDVVIKHLTGIVDVWLILFWGGVGAGIVSVPMFFFHHPTIKKKAVRGVEHFVLANIFTIIAMALVFFAISLGSVSLVGALGRVKLLFVFAEAYLLSIFLPKLLKERVGKRVIKNKLFAIVLIIIGAILTTS